MTHSNIIEVKDLKTYFRMEEGELKAVDGVSFEMKPGQTLGIIGESGCGKSITAHSIMRIISRPGRIVSGQILFLRDNTEPLDLALLRPDSETIRGIRGKEISMIFQEPMTSFAPVYTIGKQITEVITLHIANDQKKAREIAIDMLNDVGIPHPAQTIDSYPHELSGGLRQRAMIAMALSCHPSLLIADEPTTALDVTVQAQILDLMSHLQERYGMAILYITHNLGVIAEVAKEVAVMYLGKIVEYSTTDTILHTPRHPYTMNLLKAIPKVGRKARVKLQTIPGTVPMPLNRPQECGFYSRCSEAIGGVCDTAQPALQEIEPGHFVRCFLYHKEQEGD